MEASDLRHAYAVLELSPPVTEERLKRRYKALVRRWHPDRYQADPVGQAEASERLRDINIAYDVVTASLAPSEPEAVVPPSDVTDRPFSWSPERVDAIVDSINRANSWSLLPDMPDMSDWNRIISGLIALLWLGLWTLSGGVAGALMGATLILLPIACIWFPDELGDRSIGPRLITRTSSPGCVVRFAGWLLLVALIVSFIIIVAPAL